jgi:hypothetical protein
MPMTVATVAGDAPMPLPRSREPSILARPHVAFGREITGDLDAGLRREWLARDRCVGGPSVGDPFHCRKIGSIKRRLRSRQKQL